MSDVPVWIQVLQALATPAIALGVGAIGFLQWRTAHTKFVLDLFEKRLTAYRALVQAMVPVFRHGGLQEENDFWNVRAAIEGAHFLFGDDVRTMLKQLLECSATMITAHPIISDLSSPERHKWITANHDAVLKVSQIRRDLDIAMDDYIAFSEKKIPTFGGWIRHRNKVRLSYADHLQK